MSKKEVNYSQFNNSWFKRGATPIKVMLWYLTNLLFFKNGFFPFMSFKRFLLRLYGAKIGKGVIIKPNVNIKYPWRLEIGDYSWIGENVWIDNLDRVIIGKHVCVSQGAMLLTGNHDFKKVAFDLFVGQITLEDGVWIGAKSIVSSGVTCKSHSILTVMSAATKDLDAYFIYQGVPAVKVKERVIE